MGVCPVTHRLACPSPQWVVENATSCDSTFDATHYTIVTSTDSSDDPPKYTAEFTFGTMGTTTGVVVLCYKFAYAQQVAEPGSVGFVPPTPYMLFPNIRTAVVEFDAVSPTATGIGCASNVTISGKGFSAILVNRAIVDAHAGGVRCTFGGGSAVIGRASTVATVVNDTMIRCISGRPLAVGSYSLRVDVLTVNGAVLTAHLVDTFSSWGAFDPAVYRIDSMLPAGGAYNLQPDIVIRGSFSDEGEPRCRFTSIDQPTISWVGLAGTVANASYATCRKPRFPDSQRELIGFYAVTFSPNGQCFKPVDDEARFQTYNSHVEAISITGAPSTSSISVDVAGEGFVVPAMQGGRCRFTSASSGNASVPTAETQLTVDTALQTVSSTLVRCLTPTTAVPGFWTVKVLQNGVTADPALLRHPRFTEYNLESVRVSELAPPGGVTGQPTAVTVHGSGFANYGVGQLICHVTDPDGNARVVLGLLLDTQSFLCTVPPAYREGVGTLTVSLNNGTGGAYSPDVAVFRYYHAPFLASISPVRGSAQGGTLITLTGKGFTALAPGDAALRSRFLRCKFGTEVQKNPTISHTDSVLVCNSTWGAEGAQPVSVALNGLGFHNRAHEDVHGGRRATESVGGTAHEAWLKRNARALSHTGPPTLAGALEMPQFEYYGLHPPALLEAFFDAEGTKLTIRFDAQPTNRGGMNGMGACSAVLDEETTTILQGSGTAQPLCDWNDGSTLVAFLTKDSAAGAGMAVTTRSDVLWPLGYTAPCGAADSMCAPSQSYIVDAYFPCDTRETDNIEACITPTALIQAPTEIDSCPGTSFTLDASRSTGGGVRPLEYIWSASPRTCDNYYGGHQLALPPACLGLLAVPFERANPNRPLLHVR